jgi:hypothetical protein
MEPPATGSGVVLEERPIQEQQIAFVNLQAEWRAVLDRRVAGHLRTNEEQCKKSGSENQVSVTPEDAHAERQDSIITR